MLEECSVINDANMTQMNDVTLLAANHWAATGWRLSRM
jgi:hypothetical protein